MAPVRVYLVGGLTSKTQNTTEANLAYCRKYSRRVERGSAIRTTLALICLAVGLLTFNNAEQDNNQSEYYIETKPPVYGPTNPTTTTSEVSYHG